MVKLLRKIVSLFQKSYTLQLKKMALPVTDKYSIHTSAHLTGKDKSLATEIDFLRAQVEHLGKKNTVLVDKNSLQATEIDLLKDEVRIKTERNDTDYRIDAAHRQLDRVNGAIAAAANSGYVAITIQAVIVGVVTTAVPTAYSKVASLLGSIGPHANFDSVPGWWLVGSLLMFGLLGFVFLFLLSHVLRAASRAMNDAGGPFTSRPHEDAKIYAKRMRGEKPEDLEARLIGEVFDREQIGKAKGRNVSSASIGLILQVVIIGLALLDFAILADSTTALRAPSRHATRTPTASTRRPSHGETQPVPAQFPATPFHCSGPVCQ